VLPYAGTRDVARDMDAIRAALGEERISYYGVSWGAELGALYSQLFPGRVDRMVLDSATPGDLPDYEAIVGLGPPLEAALDEWAAWTAQRHGEFTLGRTAQEVRDVVSRILAHADEQPIPIGRHHVDDNTLPLLLRGLLDDEANDRALATAVRNLVDADAGQQVAVSGGLAAELETIHRRAPVVDRDVASSFATRCADGGYPTVPGDYWRQIQRHRQAQPIFGPLVHNVSPCAFWEATAQELPRVVGNDVPALIVQAERDTVTPLAGARELHRKLTASRLVTADVRAHGVYIRGVDGHGSIPCVEQAVDRYLLDGTLPAGDVRCAA
jgi:pimeloyl-ACP methyl ester carboxylesterase